jgi:predicted ArsR family transcriptional regulator
MDTLNERIGILTRREVEARILKPFLAALGERFDKEAVLDVLEQVVKEEARTVGQQMYQATDDKGLEGFASQWEPWFRGGALAIEELERNDEVWRFNVTACRYAELYRELDLADIGAQLSCNRDAALVEGYDKKISLQRSQTIMEGAHHCDFHYTTRKNS